jgi:hypothetical protein
MQTPSKHQTIKCPRCGGTNFCDDSDCIVCFYPLNDSAQYPDAQITPTHGLPENSAQVLDQDKLHKKIKRFYPKNKPTQEVKFQNNTQDTNNIGKQIKCPYCAENIMETAIKCKHCNEWLNRSQKASLAPVSAWRSLEASNASQNNSPVSFTKTIIETANHPIFFPILLSFGIALLAGIGLIASVSETELRVYGALSKTDLFFGIIFSFLLTWGVGLFIPLLLRFAILRRPIGKTSAIVTISVLWVIDLIIFIELGSKSKSHFALLLVAYVSYHVLQLEKSKKLA